MFNSNIVRFGAIFTTAMSLILSAQAASAKDNSKILPKVTVTAAQEEENGYKAETSSSSTRTDTLLLDTPQSVSVVTQDQIRDQNITTMQEAARYVPGVNVQMGEGHRDQITIRGMGATDKGTTSTFFIDGARDDAEYIRDFYNTEKIEFLKGANALAFGRGSPGGAVNRVSKSADGITRNQFVLTGGSFDNRRVENDLGGKINDKLSFRVNSMYQKSDSYRDHAEFERFGINPTITLDVSDDTTLKLGYERFEDQRFNDRGIPSTGGRAYSTNNSSFFGDPNGNSASAKLDSFYSIIDHKFDESMKIRNNTRFTRNNKFYVNLVPGTITGDNIEIKAYNSSFQRENFTNQTDLTKEFKTGSLKHKALFGTEITTQRSSKNRYKGTFDSTGTDKITVSLSDPIVRDGRHYNTIASDGRSDVTVIAGYLQDQIDINKYLQLTAGVRVDNFQVNFQNRMDNESLSRNDTMVSPRAGVVIKPQESVSLYGSYGVTYLPGSGDQFDSLSVKTETLEPEKMQNYEIGAKWDITPKLNVSAALFQLDRSQTPADDPNGGGFLVLTGESRTRGLELAANGNITDKWHIIAAFTHQNAKVTSTTTKYDAGSRVALVPLNKLSVWNKYDFTKKWAIALGITTQSDQYAAADNSVKLDKFTRFDGALYYTINDSYKLQANVENIFDEDYSLTSHGNSNILPGSPLAVNVSLTANF